MDSDVPAAAAQAITLSVFDAVLLLAWFVKVIRMLEEGTQNFPTKSLDQSLALGGVTFTVNNSEMPTVERATPNEPQAKKPKTDNDDLKASCHEAANKYFKSDSVKCTKCERWFHSNCVTDKFNDDVDTIRANKAWACWHCRGVCCLCSCVKKREGGLTVTKIEAHVGGNSTYFQLITAAKAAGYDSVQKHFKAVGHEKAW